LGVAAAGGVVVLYFATLLQDTLIKTIFLSVALLAFGITGWFWGLAPNEREYLVQDHMRATVRVEPS
jgi:hypothetical protein